MQKKKKKTFIFFTINMEEHNPPSHAYYTLQDKIKYYPTDQIHVMMYVSLRILQLLLYHRPFAKNSHYHI